ncbi:MAG: PASTA domain-containing protein [Bacteroidales bacterium]|nr:PASTA domain-containing protein [Bacteroidales bacterium]
MAKGKDISEKVKSKVRWENPVLRELYKAAGCLVLLFIVLTLLLRIVTRHNQEFEVPDLSGMNLEEADEVAHRHHLRLEVSDSVFIPTVSRGLVLRQNPRAGNMVKKNRRVLLTINTIQPKLVSMPSLTGYSLRQAKAELDAKQLTVGKLTYVYDMATDNVLSQRLNGKYISPGKMIEAGSEIDLELGDNGYTNTSVPDVTGLTLSLAKDILIENSLNLGNVHYDSSVKNYSDSISCVVIRQTPGPSRSTSFSLGTRVELYFTNDKEKIKAIKTE